MTTPFFHQFFSFQFQEDRKFILESEVAGEKLRKESIWAMDLIKLNGKELLHRVPSLSNIKNGEKERKYFHSLKC